MLLLYPFAALGTTLTNLDALSFGGTELPPMRVEELLNIFSDVFLSYVGPFMLGRLSYRSRNDAFDLLRALSIGALVYVPLLSVEFFVGQCFTGCCTDSRNKVPVRPRARMVAFDRVCS